MQPSNTLNGYQQKRFIDLYVKTVNTWTQIPERQLPALRIWPFIAIVLS
ncbi:hypothetical protein FHW88_005168 [Mucilaginibacter sp. SG538B]|nr:hypothetical protein [Mucilaginibacter sp. SG538B]